MYKLDKYTLPELKQIAMKMDIPPRRSKSEMIKDISEAFREYEEYKHRKIDKYTKRQQLGHPGKEGTTYLVVDKHGKEYAMKTFRSKKSSQKLKEEYTLQRKAYKKGVAPKPYDYDTVSKYIVMEKMDGHLFPDYNEEKKRPITKKQQERIIEIFQQLDKAGVYHNDANLCNYMIKDGEIYIIDYGFSKEITPQLVKKLGTERPNYTFMTVGFVLKMREFGYPEKSYRYILRHIPKHTIQKFQLI